MYRNEFIRMRDGVRLAVSLYIPEHGGPVPALLEALPYRKDDGLDRELYVRLRDEFDFAVCRVDLRGTGSSQGLAEDEYPPSEAEDLREVIAWLAGQSWCNGSVGMFGWSYSGFNSLQLAATRPPALRAIIPVYSSDDRYTDDVHFMGGSLRLLDQVDYPAYMAAMNAMPPVPELAGDGWRDAWRERVEVSEPWLLRWIREQQRLPYWAQGSISPNYGDITCPTMIVAGWADGYRNNTFRTAAALEGAGTPCRLLIGPWSHMGSEDSLPGPWLDLVPEMARWFDRWLRGVRNGIDDEPAVVVFERRWTAPEPDLARLNGEWIALNSASTPCSNEVSLGLGGRTVEYRVSPSVGTAAWNSCAGSLPWGQPTDQRFDDAASVTIDWPVGEAPLPADELRILGHAGLRLRVSADRPVASVSAKLCDVAPDGTSALVARALLNLTHRDGHDVGATPLPPGLFVDVEIEFEAGSWVFGPGHRLRLSLAGADWPNTIAPPSPVTLRFDLAASALTLPVLDGASLAPTPDLPYVQADPDRSAGPIWRVERDVLARTVACVTGYGSQWKSADGWRCTDRYDGRVSVDERTWEQTATATSRFEVDYPQASIATEARLRLTANATEFHVTVDVEATESGEPFASSHWTLTTARELG